ncbi:MAG TPA: hypothetical protein ENF33_02040 [Nitrososphaeria archaeon]|nr:hypothetical protein [Nitrososphaeria archaeon]
MSEKVKKSLKILCKIFSGAAIAYSAYILYNLLTTPWIYPTLNIVTIILLAGIIVFGILALLI